MTVDTAPTASGHVANKAYVDNAVAAGGNDFRGVNMMSALSASTMTHANAAAYCWNLSSASSASMDGDTTTVFTDWRLPTVEEGAVFEGTVNETNYIWTATVRDAATDHWIYLRLSDGYWTYNKYNSTNYVSCVR